MGEIHVLSRCHSVRAACSRPTAASQAVTAAAGPSITSLLVGFLSLAGSCWCPGPRAGLSAWQLSETAAPCPLAESRPCCTSGTSCTKDLLADGAPSSAGNTLRRKEKMILSAFWICFKCCARCITVRFQWGSVGFSNVLATAAWRLGWCKAGQIKLVLCSAMQQPGFPQHPSSTDWKLGMFQASHTSVLESLLLEIVVLNDGLRF